MRSLLDVGRVLLAVAVLGFGVLYLLTAAKVGSTFVGPPFYPTIPWLTWAAGLGFLALAIAMFTRRIAWLAAALLGTGFLLRVLAVHLPELLRAADTPGPWTTGGEVLSLAGGAWTLAAICSQTDSNEDEHAARLWLARGGQMLFALPLIIFGVQHMIYGRFVANLLLSWMPWHLFWAYFVGAAFFAAALAIVVAGTVGLARQLGRLASLLLGIMFSLWVVMLHAPLVASHPKDGNQWTSALIALGMAGCSFNVAVSLRTVKKEV